MRYEKFISRQMVRESPNSVFVFGDNLARRGMDGQAKEMRGEPNAIGIPTKRAPSMEESAFFTDADFPEALLEIYRAAMKLTCAVIAKREIVWPADGIGTGRAQLERRAPRIWRAIEILRMTLSTQK